MSILRWLRPRGPLRGLLFGYLFGFAAWFALLVSFMIKDGHVYDGLLSDAAYGFFWAIPWAALWCICGALVSGAPRYPGTVVTILGIASGTIYSLADSTFDGWQSMTIPIYSIVSFVIWHAAAIPLWLLICWVRGESPEE